MTLRVFLLLTFAGAALGLASLTAQGCGDDTDVEAQTQVSTQASTQASRRITPVDREVFAYTEPTPTFAKVLNDLDEAASSGGTYPATRRARSLGPVERSAVSWLCETAWQLDVNNEIYRLADPKYLPERIGIRIMLDVAHDGYSDKGKAPYLAPVDVAVDELQRVVGLSSFDAKKTMRYKKACYG